MVVESPVEMSVYNQTQYLPTIDKRCSTLNSNCPSARANKNTDQRLRQVPRSDLERCSQVTLQDIKEDMSDSMHRRWSDLIQRMKTIEDC
jgi:hypothetical protein